MAKKTGRPPLKLTDLPKDWKKRVLSLMSEGASKVEVCVALKIGKDALAALRDREPEFAATLQEGELMCEAWWENVGRISLYAKTFNTGLWYANMKNRFGWRDKQETEVSGGITVQWLK